MNSYFIHRDLIFVKYASGPIVIIMNRARIDSNIDWKTIDKAFGQCAISRLPVKVSPPDNKTKQYSVIYHNDVSKLEVLLLLNYANFSLN